MIRKNVILIAALAVFAFASVASADITVWVGQVESDDFLIEGTQSWGGAIGFDFAKFFGVELVVDYVQDSELPFNLEEMENLFGLDLEVDMLFLSGNLVVKYPAAGFTPYATIGYGAFGMSVSSDLYEDLEDQLSGTTMMNYGFGAKLDVAPYLAIRGEWREYSLDFSDTEVENILTIIDNPSFSRMAIGVAITF